MSKSVRALSLRRGVTIAAMAILLGACGSPSDAAPNNSGEPVGEPTTELALTDTTTTIIDDVEATTSTVAESTTTTSTSTTSTSTTSSTTTIVEQVAPTTEVLEPDESAPNDQPPGISQPEDVDGAVASEAPSLRVVTGPDDNLNVRSGPGVSYEIVNGLRDGTFGISSTHLVETPQGTWRFIQASGNDLGWVNSAYLNVPCSVSTPTPPQANFATELFSDIDLDGGNDVIEVYYRELGNDMADLWVRTTMSNGDALSGTATGPFSTLVAPSAIDLHAGRLTHLPANFTSEQIMVTAYHPEGDTTGYILGIDGCDIVPTTFDGEPFRVSLEESVLRSTVSCGFDVHGELEFEQQIVDFTEPSGNFSSVSWNLGPNLVWSGGQLNSWVNANGDVPDPLDLSFCNFESSFGAVPTILN